MNIKVCAIALSALVTVALLGGVVSADTGYDASQNTYVTLNTGSGTPSTGTDTGQTTFAAQEGAHETLNSLTGQNVKHSYIVVTVDGNRFYIDPPEALN